MSKIFPDAVEPPITCLPDVDVRLATLRIVPDDDFLVEKFPIDRQEQRNVLQERRWMKI